MDDDDRFFGFFQQFRPNGEGIDEQFRDIPNANDYLVRLRELYSATSDDKDSQDVYFIVRQPRPSSDAERIELGNKLLSGLQEIANSIDHQELQEYLRKVKCVEVVPAEQFDNTSDENALVHECIGDAIHAYEDGNNPIATMGEGFYSVACDYWLGWYLQWPYFQGQFSHDPLRSYFDLWLRGSQVAFQGNALKITSPASRR